MRGPGRSDRDTAARLRETLRAADPVQEWGEPSRHEMARLRQQVLQAAARRQASPLPRRLAAAAAVLVVLAAGAWLLRPATPAGDRLAATGPAEPPVEVAGTGAGVARDSGVASAPGGSATEPESEPVAASEAVSGRPSDPAAVAGAVAGGGPPESAAETLVAREIRFETEGGTRLIWIFHEDDEKGVT